MTIIIGKRASNHYLSLYIYTYIYLPAAANPAEMRLCTPVSLLAKLPQIWRRREVTITIIEKDRIKFMFSVGTKLRKVYGEKSKPVMRTTLAKVNTKPLYRQNRDKIIALLAMLASVSAYRSKVKLLRCLYTASAIYDEVSRYKLLSWIPSALFALIIFIIVGSL